MANSILATIKGTFNTSIRILLDTMHQVGDVISFKNITHMVPQGEDYTRFFHECVNFCTSNGDTRFFRINDIRTSPDGYELIVSPVFLGEDRRLLLNNLN